MSPRRLKGRWAQVIELWLQLLPIAHSLDLHNSPLSLVPNDVASSSWQDSCFVCLWQLSWQHLSSVTRGHKPATPWPQYTHTHTHQIAVAIRSIQIIWFTLHSHWPAATSSSTCSNSLSPIWSSLSSACTPTHTNTHTATHSSDKGKI